MFMTDRSARMTPQNATLDSWHNTFLIRFLSTSFISVSIFSVCCYSRVSISVIFTHLSDQVHGDILVTAAQDRVVCAAVVGLQRSRPKQLLVMRRGQVAAVGRLLAHCLAVGLRRIGRLRLRIHLQDF